MLLPLARRPAVNDATGPSTPGTPALAAAAGTDAFTVTWAPASDVSGVAGYRVYFSLDPAAPARISANNIDTVACTWTFSGLVAGTAYRVRVEAIDVFGNLSSLSGTVTITTATAGTVSQYRNPYNETFAYLQGNTNSNGVETSATTRAELARYDVATLQWKWTTAKSAEEIYLAQLRTAHPHLKLLMYTDPMFWFDGDQTLVDSNGTAWHLYMTIATNGAPATWRARNAAGQDLAFSFSPSDTRCVNWANQADVNSNGDTLRVAWLKRLEVAMRLDLYDGIMIDDANAIGNNRNVRGVGGGANWDYDSDGVDEDYRADPAFKAAWSEGCRAMFDAIHTRYPGKMLQINTDIGFWYRQTDTDGCPRRPIEDFAYAQNDDVPFIEGAFAFNMGLGNMGDESDTYPVKGFFSIDNFYLGCALYDRIARPAATNLMGAPVVFLHNQVCIGDTAAPSQTTYAMARFWWAAGRLCGQSYGGVRSGSRSFPLDETCLDLGAPVSTISMGTLNQSSAPVTFTRRAANATNGTALFYWVEHERALIVARLDITGISPGSSNFGAGSASTYTLPSAGAGFKWQRPNCATYVHPTIPALSMQNQSPSLNNGADVTSSSLRPLHAEVFLRVAA